MELIFGIAVGLIILVILVVLHELGHAIVAHRNGVVVEEFGIGFPPRAWGKKLKNGVVFTLNWLPLGGFVKLQGEYDSAKEKGDYGAATFWQKTKILLAGVAINWLTAALLLTVLAWTGLPKVLPDQFSLPNDTRLVTHPVEIKVAKDSPAEKAGLQTGDELRSLAGKKITIAQDLSQVTETYKGKKVEAVYVRDGKEQRSMVSLRANNTDGKGYFGVGASSKPAMIHTTWSAPIVGIGTTVQLTGATLDGLGKLVGSLASGLGAQFSGDPAVKKTGSEQLQAASEGVSGPVGIFGVLFPAASSAGLTQLTFLAAIISLSLAIFNTLPIPALDGGRWFVMALFRLLKKPLTKEREEKIQTVGFLTLMALVVVVTFVDVDKLIK